MSLMDGLQIWCNGTGPFAEYGAFRRVSQSGGSFPPGDEFSLRTSYRMDAGADYLSLGQAGAGLGQTGMTVCGWVLPVDIVNSHTCIAKYQAGVREWDLQTLSGTGWRMSTSTTGAATNNLATAAGAVSVANRWTFACGVLDPKEALIKVHAWQLSSYVYAQAAYTDLPPDRGGITTIGANVGYGIVNQRIRGCGIWDRILSFEEMLMLYNADGQFPSEGSPTGAGGVPVPFARFDGNPFAGVS